MSLTSKMFWILAVAAAFGLLVLMIIFDFERAKDESEVAPSILVMTKYESAHLRTLQGIEKNLEAIANELHDLNSKFYRIKED